MCLLLILIDWDGCLSKSNDALMCTAGKLFVLKKLSQVVYNFQYRNKTNFLSDWNVMTGIQLCHAWIMYNSKIKILCCVHKQPSQQKHGCHLHVQLMLHKTTIMKLIDTWWLNLHTNLEPDQIGSQICGDIDMNVTLSVIIMLKWLTLKLRHNTINFNAWLISDDMQAGVAMITL